MCRSRTMDSIGRYRCTTGWVSSETPIAVSDLRAVDVASPQARSINLKTSVDHYPRWLTIWTNETIRAMPVHPNGESNYGVYSTLLFNFCCVTILCNNAYYASLCLAKNKNQRTLNPIQLRFLGWITTPLLRKIPCRTNIMRDHRANSCNIRVI